MVQKPNVIAVQTPTPRYQANIAIVLKSALPASQESESVFILSKFKVKWTIIPNSIHQMTFLNWLNSKQPNPVNFAAAKFRVDKEHVLHNTGLFLFCQY